MGWCLFGSGMQKDRLHVVADVPIALQRPARANTFRPARWRARVAIVGSVARHNLKIKAEAGSSRGAGEGYLVAPGLSSELKTVIYTK